MNRNAVETVMGAVVLVVAALFLFFAYTTSQVRAVTGYDVTARFDRVEGLRDGGDVRISGIKVGTIISQTLDEKSYLAVVKMSIDPSVKLPTDTVATIASNGLLGDKYLSLVPGADDDFIKPGGTIAHTQPPISLESMIGQFIYGQTGGGGGQQQKPGADSAAPPK
jgi:phospholipid/cholesterol/gamma-HCH transport system substrate-binding protein